MVALALAHDAHRVPYSSMQLLCEEIGISAASPDSELETDSAPPRPNSKVGAIKVAQKAARTRFSHFRSFGDTAIRYQIQSILLPLHATVPRKLDVASRYSNSSGHLTAMAPNCARE